MTMWDAPPPTLVPNPQVPTQQPGLLSRVGQALFPSQLGSQPSTQQPGLLSQIGQGIQSRNILPALALGGLIGLLPPLLYGKRSRQGAGRAWGQLGMHMGMNELQRPEREKQNKQAALDRLLSAGMASTTGAPGAQPLGDMAGTPIYRMPTFAERFPEQFGGGSTVPRGMAETDLATGATTTVGGSPTPPLSSAMQVFGGLPYTEANARAVAKMAGEREQAEQEAARRAATNQSIQQWAEGSGGVAVPKMGAKGQLEYGGQLPKSVTSKQSEREYRVELRNQALGYKMGPAAEEEYIKSMKGSSLEEALVKDRALQEQRDVRVEISGLDEVVLGSVARLPAIYQPAAETFKTWEALAKNPDAMSQIGEQKHAEIGALLRARDKATDKMQRFEEGTNGQTPRGQKVAPPDSYSPDQVSALVKDLHQKGKERGAR